MSESSAVQLGAIWGNLNRDGVYPLPGDGLTFRHARTRVVFQSRATLGTVTANGGGLVWWRGWIPGRGRE